MSRREFLPLILRMTNDRYRWWKLASAILIAAYFLYFAKDCLDAHWAVDDAMNIHVAWEPGAWDLLLQNFRIWRGDYRPMGGVYYATLFHWFGFNPFPYRVVILLLLGLNVWLTYLAARRLGCDELRGALAAILVAYHARLGALHYNTDIIYDILCFTFYVSALTFYAGVRLRGRLPDKRETIILFALFLAALNAKEMAVTLPVALLCYEALYHPPDWRRWRALREWAFGPCRAALWMAVVNLVYIYGKKFGPNPLMANASYVPVFSWKRFLAFHRGSVRDLLLFMQSDLGNLGLLAIAVLLIWLAWRHDRRELRFCWLFMLIAPLPITFLDGRLQAALYIPLLGWAIFAAVVLADLAEGAAKLAAKRPFWRTAVTAALLVAAFIPWVRKNERIHRTYIVPGMYGQAPLTNAVLKQFQTMRPSVPPGSRVVFLNDPFKDWDMFFIARLVFHDRSVNVVLQRMAKLPPEELAKIPYQFAFENGKVVQVKPAIAGGGSPRL